MGKGHVWAFDYVLAAWVACASRRVVRVVN